MLNENMKELRRKGVNMDRREDSDNKCYIRFNKSVSSIDPPYF